MGHSYGHIALTDCIFWKFCLGPARKFSTGAKKFDLDGLLVLHTLWKHFPIVIMILKKRYFPENITINKLLNIIPINET